MMYNRGPDKWTLITTWSAGTKSYDYVLEYNDVGVVYKANLILLLSSYFITFSSPISPIESFWATGSPQRGHFNDKD